MAYTNVKFGITNPNFGSNEYQASFTVGGNTNGTFGIQPIPEQPVQNINGFNNVSTPQFGSAYSNSNQNTQNTQTQQVSNPTKFNKPWWSSMGSFGNFLFGTDTYQTLLNQGQDAWGRSVFGSNWDTMDPNNRDMYWTQALHNAEFSPNRYQGGLFNSLGSFRDISALGISVAGLLNQKKMADRQYSLQKEAFDLSKQDWQNREARAKEEFAARRNARSGGQI